MAHHRFHVKNKSDNTKTGHMAVITSTRSTCPNNCEFNHGNGCYAEYHYMRHWWDMLEQKNVGDTFSKFIQKLKAIPSSQHIRLWDAGDCPGNKTLLDKTKCIKIADTLKDRNGTQFGYTHYDMNIVHNRNVVRMMLRRNTIVNVSTLPSYVDRVMNMNLPTAVVVPEPMDNTPEGKPIFMCPNQMAKLNNTEPVTCDSCMKCALWPRNYAIGFIPHGTGKKKVESIAKASLEGINIYAKTRIKRKGTEKTQLSHQ